MIKRKMIKYNGISYRQVISSDIYSVADRELKTLADAKVYEHSQFEINKAKAFRLAKIEYYEKAYQKLLSELKSVKIQFAENVKKSIIDIVTGKNPLKNWNNGAERLANAKKALKKDYSYLKRYLADGRWQYFSSVDSYISSTAKSIEGFYQESKRYVASISK